MTTPWEDAVTAKTPSSWYKLNEASGTTLVAAVGTNGVTAATNITHNVAGLIPGDPGGKSKITANGGLIDTGTAVPHPGTATGVSIVWTYKGTTANVAGNGEIFRRLTTTTGTGFYSVRINATHIAVTQWGAATAGWNMCLRGLLLDNVAHLVIMTLIDNQFKIYIDGVLQGTVNGVSSGGTPVTGTGAMRWARNSGSDFTSGNYDDLVTYAYILDQDDVDDVYEGWLGEPRTTTPVCDTSTDESIGITWPTPGGPSPTSYKVRVDGGSATDVGLVNAHTFTGLSPSTTYQLGVQVCNAVGCSDWTEIECTTLPAAVTPVADPITTTGATICWPTAGDDVIYEISLDGDPLPDTTELCVDVTGLNPGTTHTFCVTPCNETGCADETCIEFTTLAPSVPWSVCPCGPGWRIEVCNLATGRVHGVLMPTAMDFQVMLNEQGKGQLTLPVRSVRALDVWPDYTSVYITRQDMDPANDDCLFAGIVRAAPAANGTVTLGLESIESYLWRRRLKRDLSFSGVGQNQIAAALVAETVANGIPLTGVAETPGPLLNRDYLETDRAYIGPLLEQFTNSENGPSWRLEHTRTGGSWSTRIVFADTVGDDRDTVLRSDRDFNEYGLTLDSDDHATWIDGFNQATPPLTSNANDLSIYPEFDADPTFDAPLQETLDQQTVGALAARGDIAATPTATLLGETIKASGMRLGDSAVFHLNQGFIQFHGRARVFGITYRVGEDQPLTRELALVPTDTAVESVMNAADLSQCPDCR